MNSKITVNDFSKHLFWDVDLEKFDLNCYQKFIIERVLEYGTLQDWNNIKELYGKETIKELSVELRNISPVTLSFLSTILKIDEKKFKWYTIIQSSQNFWNS